MVQCSAEMFYNMLKNWREACLIYRR